MLKEDKRLLRDEGRELYDTEGEIFVLLSKCLP
jgi:hypothetical protein